MTYHNRESTIKLNVLRIDNELKFVSYYFNEFFRKKKDIRRCKAVIGIPQQMVFLEGLIKSFWTTYNVFTKFICPSPT